MKIKHSPCYRGIVVGSLLSCALGVITARAAVVVSIPFDSSAPPQSLFNLSYSSVIGASGITGNFMNAANSGVMTAGAALTYSVSGGGTISAGSSGLSLDAASGNYTSVAYSSPLTGQTLFVRFLYKTSGTGNRCILSLGNIGTVNAPNTTGTPRFDLNGTAIQVDAAGTGINSSSATALAANTTYLIVARVNWNGAQYSSMDLWVNPAYSSTPPASGYVTASGGTATSLAAPVFRSLTGTMSMDGFVIGTTWADVVPAGGGIVARTFYVATNGNDSYTTAQATNLATPWRTLQKAASIMQAGDTCLIRSGIYRETVTPVNSGVTNTPITFAPYPGESVVVSGADVITPSWSAYSNSIYVASTGLSFRQLFVDGVMMNESRWPNAQTDNLLQAPRSKVVVGDTSNVTLVDTNLPNVNLVGAKLHVFPGQNVGGEYAAFTRTISSYDSAAKKLYWSPGWQQSAGYYLTAGNPYYLYGALSLLDIPTEWYLDSGAGNLYLWTPDGASPAAHRVEVKARASAFVLDNRSYITLSNLYVFAAGVSMANTINCVVDNCHLRYVQHDTTADWSSGSIAAACAVSGSGSVWKNSSLRFSSQYGLKLDGANALVTNCVIQDVDYYPGAYYESVTPSAGGGHKIIGNTLTGSGRGLITAGTSTEIAYNNMGWSGLLTGDGGAFYAYGVSLVGTKIHHNWIHHGEVGIYLDNGTYGCEVYRNVSFDNDIGIQLNTPGTNHLVYNNTLRRNPVSFPSPFNSNGADTQAGTKVINNLCDGTMAFKADCTTNKNGWFPPLGADFVPQAGSGAIDGGTNLPPYTDGFVGAAPDIGAYEVGGVYWTPGATFSAPPFPTPDSTNAPPAPTGLTVSPISETIGLGLFWNASPAAVSYYKVKRSTTFGGPYAEVATVTVGTFYTDSNVIPGQTYYYVVSAVNSIGEGPNSSAASGTPGANLIMDSSDTTGITIVGTWYLTALAGSYRNNGLFASGSEDSVTYTPSIPVSGNYQVYLQWGANANRANNTPVTVNGAGGTFNLTVNQQINGGQWNLLGTFQFNAGTNGTLVIRDNGANGFVVADGVKFVMLPPLAPTGLQAVFVASNRVDLSWNATATATSYVIRRATQSGGPYVTIAAGVTATNYSDLTAVSGAINYYIVSAVSGGGEGPNSNEASAATMFILDNADATGVAITGAWTPSTVVPGYYASNYLSDGLPIGSGNKRVTFTPNLLTAGSNQVFLRWTAGPDRASNVPVDVNGANGTTTLFVNQQNSNGVWVLLGTFPFLSGTNGSVVVRNDGANGLVIADAVQFIPITSVLLAATPTISPDGGTFTNIQTVTLACTTPGASIRYTTNGSTPTATDGALYSVPFTVGASATVKAVSFSPGYELSAVASAAFTINLPPAAAPVISPNGGTVDGPQTIVLSTTTPGATIRYTTDGSTPTASVGTIYAGPFVQNSSATVKAAAYSVTNSLSPVTSATFTITYAAAGNPTLLEPFNYNSGSTIHNQSGGSGFGGNWLHSQTGNGSGTIVAALTPPPAFPYATTGLSANIPGSSWEYYRVLSSSAPDNRVNLGANGVRYFSLLFRLESDAVGYQYLNLTDAANNFGQRLSLFGIKNMSPVSFVGVVPNGSVPEVSGASISTVYFVVGKIVSSASGSDSLSLKVYSGSTPLDSIEPAAWTQTATFTSSLVLDRIRTGSGMTIDEIRFGPDWGSVINQITPTKTAAPAISPLAGNYGAPLTVSLVCATPGSTIRYTTDGTTPTSSSGTVYSGNFLLNTSATIKAIAYSSGIADSPVTSATFTLPPVVPPAPVLGASVSGSTFSLSFASQAGASYTLLESTNLSGWLSVTNWTGNGSNLVFSIPVTGTPARFYRVTSP